MSKIQKIKKMWKKNPKQLFAFGLHSMIENSFLTYLWPDKAYLKLFYYKRFGRSLNLDDPQTLNEKLQRLKLNNKNPHYTTLVDKIKVKDALRDEIGDKYLIKTLGVWDCFDDIDFDKLPNQFVLKCNHDSGSYYVVPDKSKMDKEAARKKLSKGLRTNYFYLGREWPYKNVKPQILAEEFIGKNGKVPEDYKIMTINGTAANMMVCTDRDSGTTKYYFFDKSWKLIRCNKWGELAPEGFSLPKPEAFDEMINLAEKLSKNLPFARIDLYEVEGKIYFGEITFYPNNGFDTNLYYEEDLRLGQMLDLSKLGGNQ